MDLHEVIVRRKWIAADGIAAFELVDPAGKRMPAFTPGAHVAVSVGLPSGARLLRTYSLCNAPAENYFYLLGVKREPASRGGSVAMHELVKTGDALQISLPINNFPLASSADSHLLLGAGIGITPLLSMAQHLHAEGKAFAMHYFARGADHVAFRDRLAPLESAGLVHYHLGLSSGETEACLCSIMAGTDDGRHAYACGPAPFMDTVHRLGAESWTPQRLHFEHFQAPAEVPSAGAPFELRLRRSGLHCTVDPLESILCALGRIGVKVDTSCEQGVCGTCLTRVLAGEPEHRDAYLTDAERAANDQMLICVGRSRSPVLELDL